MKNFRISAYLLLLIILVLAACNGMKAPLRPEPDRGKIIETNNYEEEVDGVMTQFVEGTVCYCDTVTYELVNDRKKKFKVKKRDIPTWFIKECSEDGSWVLYANDTIPPYVRIIGYVKKEAWSSCKCSCK